MPDTYYIAIETSGGIPDLMADGTVIARGCEISCVAVFDSLKGTLMRGYYSRSDGGSVENRFSPVTDADVQGKHVFDPESDTLRGIFAPGNVFLTWNARFLAAVLAVYHVSGVRLIDVQKLAADQMQIPYPSGCDGFKPPKWTEACEFFGCPMPVTTLDKVRTIKFITSEVKALSKLGLEAT